MNFWNKLLDFLVKNLHQQNLKLKKLNKMKKYQIYFEQFIIGEVRYSESYSHINVHPLKECVVVRVCDDVDGEIKKSISDEQVSVGRLQFKVLQFCYQTNVNVKL